MSHTIGRSGQVLAVVFVVLMVLWIPAVAAAPTAAGPNIPDDGTPTGDDSANNTTEASATDYSIPTGASPLETADAVLAGHSGDATLAREQLALAGDLQAIVDDSSRSDRDQALDTAEAVLEQRKQWAARKDRPLTPSMVPLFEVALTKIDGSRSLLERNEDLQDAGGLTRGVELAKQGTKLQASMADDSVTMESDLPDIQTQNHASPSAATLALMERYGATPTAQDMAKLQALDDQPEPVRTALTDYLDAFLAFQRETARGDMTRTFAARNQLLDATADLNDALEKTGGFGLATPQHNAPGRTKTNGKTQVGCVQHSTQKKIIRNNSTLSGLPDDEGSGGVVVDARVDIDHDFCVLQIGDETSQDDSRAYTHNTVVLIDEGGDDEYHMNAGGTNLDDDSSNVTEGGGDGRNRGPHYQDNHGATNVTHPLRYYEAPIGEVGDNNLIPVNNTLDADVAAALVDLGQNSSTNGNDEYTRNDSIGWGQRGGAMIGSGFLVDATGTDQYGNETANNSHFGTNGGSVNVLSDTTGCCRDAVATGFLLDNGSNDPNHDNGKDEYIAGTGGANGGGAKGDDAGAGFLMDTEGSSYYEAGWFGVNGGASEQQGFLADLGGDDTYKAQGYGAIGGTLYGSPVLPATPIPENVGGFLLDADGSDHYNATSEGTNGGASSQNNGFLLDAGTASGTETFQAGHDVTHNADRTNPGSFDTGPNSSQAGLQGVNGGGYEQGVGVLINVNGESEYLAGDGLGSNGGAALIASGLIVDGERDKSKASDTYKAGIDYIDDEPFNNPAGFFGKIRNPSAGSNGGGALGGVGAIVDVAGGDTYKGMDGQFGGVNGTNGGAWSLGNGAAGLSFDNNGTDTYEATADDGPVTGANGGGSGYAESRVSDTIAPVLKVLCETINPCLNESRQALRATGTLTGNGTVSKDVPGVAKGHADKYRAVATDNDETANETVAGVNGGAYGTASTGLLVEARGDNEEYKAKVVNTTKNETKGANGGVYVPVTSSVNRTVGGPGVAVLLDAAGEGDDYTQEQCDSTDDTWLPKGITGAQIDSTYLGDTSVSVAPTEPSVKVTNPNDDPTQCGGSGTIEEVP